MPKHAERNSLQLPGQWYAISGFARMPEGAQQQLQACLGRLKLRYACFAPIADTSVGAIEVILDASVMSAPDAWQQMCSSAANGSQQTPTILS
eukprot:7037164-Alexandrium_andersonii.AAC.1